MGVSIEAAEDREGVEMTEEKSGRVFGPDKLSLVWGVPMGGFPYDQLREQGRRDARMYGVAFTNWSLIVVRYKKGPNFRSRTAKEE